MRRDVVFSFTTETLDDAARRGYARPPGRLLQTLVADERIGTVLVADPTRWLVSRLLRRTHPAPPPGPGVVRVRPWRLSRREGSTLDAVRADVERRESLLRRAARRHGVSRPAVVSFDPFLAAFGDLSWCGPVTFYARDDWASFPPRRPWWPVYERAYAEIRRRGRGVVAVSTPLLARIDPTGPAAVVPNGIDPDEWRRPPPPPAWMDGLTRPVAVYAGTVDDRVDADLIRATTRVATVVLLGPLRGPGRDLVPAPRVHHAVASRRDEVAAVVSGADVGLVPHRATELTAAMSPLKLYEYRAAGLPVASVDLEPVVAEARHDPAIICAPPEPDAFVAAVETARERGRDDEADRLAYLETASWAGRHRRALEIVLR